MDGPINSALARMDVTISQLKAELDETRNELEQKEERLIRAENELLTVQSWQLVGIISQFRIYKKTQLCACLHQKYT